MIPETSVHALQISFNFVGVIGRLDLIEIAVSGANPGRLHWQRHFYSHLEIVIIVSFLGL